MYFLAGFAPWNDKETGPDLKMGGKTFLGYVGGIGCSVAIFELNKLFASLNIEGGTAWGLYLAVFIVVVGVICFEKVPGFNFVPSWFVGAGVFFALMTFAGGARPAGMSDWGWYGVLTTVELIACAIGLLYGMITVEFRGRYEAKIAQATPQVDPA